ncbi:rifin [Plasmodium reichenowi]|uniref:Rifin n=1 Tax=Plasmodium reichenowi TaxID=5854 RepID=A0A060RM17_PLARE|nr:rifin [Plasmodium reichenowi]
MKLHCANILLFAFLLNILAHNNNNEPHSTPHHTPIYTSRVLSECDTQSSIYDKDAHMKSVMQQFDDRTSERLREYDERMQDKRQKHKEQRDKNIQKIIEKDKMDKSLAEKVEIGCLRCGCGLGGVAASVGLFGGLGTYGWEISATAAAAKAAGDAAGVKALINGLEETFRLEKLFNLTLKEAITPNNYFDTALISEGVKDHYQSLCLTGSTCKTDLLYNHYSSRGEPYGTQAVVESAKKIVGEAVGKASKVTTEFTGTETAAASKQLYSAIGYSVLAILIIVLVMVIIYLVLRYRRKKKMKKKAQYTKLLNQ